MIHHRQRLPLGFETRDDAFRVHAQLDDLERDAAADGLLLFGHANDAAAAFADLLEQFVAADPSPGFSSGGIDKTIVLFRPAAGVAKNSPDS